MNYTWYAHQLSVCVNCVLTASRLALSASAPIATCTSSFIITIKVCSHANLCSCCFRVWHVNEIKKRFFFHFNCCWPEKRLCTSDALHVPRSRSEFKLALHWLVWTSVCHDLSRWYADLHRRDDTGAFMHRGKANLPFPFAFFMFREYFWMFLCKFQVLTFKCSNVFVKYSS